MSPGGETASTSTQITTTDAATLQEKKHSLEKTLANLEKQIYALETSYLEDTTTVGNILRGWDGYLSNRSASAIGRKKFKEADRLFSLSSATALKNNDIEPEQPESSRKEGRHDDKDRSDRPHKQAKLRDSSGVNNLPKVKKGPGRPRKNPQPIRNASDEELDV